MSRTTSCLLLPMLTILLAGCTKKLPPCEDKVSVVGDYNGLNWADRRDNFVDGYIQPSGLDSGFTFQQFYNTSLPIIQQFKTLAQTNTIRLAINAPTVLKSDYYQRWKGLVAAALQLDVKVILACWERPLEKDGRADADFMIMWDKVIADYSNEPNVMFEPMNEPYGYSAPAWKELAHTWLQRYPALPRNRVLIGGTGYSEYLDGMACDSRFAGCLFSIHLYTWFAQAKTTEAWNEVLEQRIGKTQSGRVLITEFGAPMSTGIDYLQQHTQADAIYLNALCRVIAGWDMGSIYWPGLRDFDTFSLLQRNTQNQLQVVNNSGLNLVLSSFQ